MKQYNIRYVYLVLFAVNALIGSICTQPVPVIDFRSYPTNDPKAIALTFDDGPESSPGNTNAIMDILLKYKIPATFFVDLNFVDLSLPAPTAAIKRMVANNFTIGCHTEKHSDLTTLTMDQIRLSVNAVRNAVNSALGYNYRMTLMRAPFGLPYLDVWDGGSARLDEISTVIYNEKFIHVGWSVDTTDYQCGITHPDAPVQCVIDNIKARLSENSWGVTLFHDVYKHTADSLETIIKYLISEGYHFISVEDVIKSKYGVYSYELVNQNIQPIPQQLPSQPPSPPPTQPSTQPPAQPNQPIASSTASNNNNNNNGLPGNTNTLVDSSAPRNMKNIHWLLLVCITLFVKLFL